MNQFIKSVILAALLITGISALYAQDVMATTDDGKRVVLHDNGTWKYISESKTPAKIQPKSITVYVTRTGSKYHRGTCRYLAKSKIPMDLKVAAQNYGPCSVCSPPRLN